VAALCLQRRGTIAASRQASLPACQPAAQWRRVLGRARAAGNVLSIGIEDCSMVAMARARIQEHFATLDDPRVERTRRHDLAAIGRSRCAAAS
jgi:hypothetical protein